MTIENKNVPAPVAAGNEDINESAKNSTTTAYLSRWGSNTRDTFGTWCGAQLPQGDYVTAVIPLSAAARMVRDGGGFINLNSACVKAQSAAARAARENKRIVLLNNKRNVITRGTEGDILYSIELLDVLGTDEWTEEYEVDGREFLEEVLGQDVEAVTAELLVEARHVRRQQRDAQLAALDEEIQ